MNLPKELTKQMKVHLNEVRKYLGNLPADERQEILQSIESHIYDALQSRSNGEPTAALLDAVLAEMDPPESYGELPPQPAKKKSFHWRIVIPSLILIAVIIAGIKWWPTEKPTVVGRWVSVDFVSSIEQFDPEAKSWRGDLYLKELTFLPDGKTDRPFWTWQNDILHHSGDNTNAKFIIKRISGREYLFLQWMSADVTIKGHPPKYYVLKKIDLKQLTPVTFELGLNTLKDGDSIVLNEILASSPNFAEGDTVTVKGRYTLSSQPSARLSLLVTGTRGRGRSNVTREQQIGVTQGSGEFKLTLTVPYYGCPHLTFYEETTEKNSWNRLGGLYFGTKEQVEEIKSKDSSPRNTDK